MSPDAPVKWSADRILEEAVRSGDCLVFKAGQKRKYPQVYIRGKHPLAYRVVFAEKVGPIPNGVQIHHKCANTRCVNPNHLETADQAANMLEMLGRRSYEARIRALEDKVNQLEQELEEIRAAVPK